MTCLPPPLKKTAGENNLASFFPDIEGIDMTVAKVTTDNDFGFYLQLLNVFVQEHANTVSLVQTALKTSDFHLAKQCLHFLKGGSSTIGAKELAKLAAELELRVLDPDVTYEEALPMLDSLNHAMLNINKTVKDLEIHYQ